MRIEKIKEMMDRQISKNETQNKTTHNNKLKVELQ
jgi:hypothetical protein